MQSKIESSNNKLSEKEKNTSVKNSYKTIVEENELIKIVNYIKKVGFFAIDTETDSIKPNNANLIGISLSWEKGQACYIPILHTDQSYSAIN